MKYENRYRIFKMVFYALMIAVFGVLGYIICNSYNSELIKVYDERTGFEGQREDGYSIAVSDEELDAISLKADSFNMEKQINKNKIDINTAIPDAFMLIDDIGSSKAESIVRMRYEIGGFKCIEDLQNVSGISKKTFDKIKNMIYASDDFDAEKDAKFIKIMDKENKIKEFEKEWESLLDD